MSPSQEKRGHRVGSSFLEIQVAMVILGIALAGLCPLVVMQSKVLRRIESGDLGKANGQTVQGQRMVDGQVYGPDSPPSYCLTPNADPWVRRMGVAATIATSPPARFDPVLVADDSASLASGWEEESKAASAAYLGSDQVRKPGAMNSTPYIWPALVAKVPGYYVVLVTWPPDASNTSKASFSVVWNGEAIGSVIENQTRAPSGMTQDLRPWQDLGLFIFLDSGDQLTISVDAAATDRVVADGVMMMKASKRNPVAISSPLWSNDASAGIVVNVGTAP